MKTETECEPYEGNEKFIFVSYSHKEKDKEEVIAIMNRLNREGFRIWYDKGIQGGDKYKGVIFDHIYRCEVFIPFFSTNYKESDFCHKEINYADNNRKKILPVYIEKIHFSSDDDITACIVGLHELYKYEYSSDNEKFFHELINSNMLQECKISVIQPPKEMKKSFAEQICEIFKDYWPALVAASFGITFFNIENINIFFNHYTQVVTTHEADSRREETKAVSDDKVESDKIESTDIHKIISADENVSIDPAPKPQPAITPITPAAKIIWKLEATGTGNSLGITLYMGSGSLAGKNTKSRSDDPRNHFTFSISNAQNGQVCKVSSNVEVKSVKGGKRNGDTITFSGGSAEISAVRKW